MTSSGGTWVYVFVRCQKICLSDLGKPETCTRNSLNSAWPGRSPAFEKDCLGSSEPNKNLQSLSISSASHIWTRHWEIDSSHSLLCVSWSTSVSWLRFSLTIQPINFASEFFNTFLQTSFLKMVTAHQTRKGDDLPKSHLKKNEIGWQLKAARSLLVTRRKHESYGTEKEKIMGMT